MNFTKRTGVVLVVFAIIASSCNKHLDDFKPIINTTTYGPNQSVAGVAALATNILTLRSAITSTQTTIATLPETTSTTALKTSLTAINGRIDAIWSALNTIALNGAPTKAIIDGLKTDLTALPAKVVTDNDALKAQIAAIGTSNDALTARLNELVKSNNALAVHITSVQKFLDTLRSFHDLAATQVSVDALSVQLVAAQFSFDLLLATYMP